VGRDVALAHNAATILASGHLGKGPDFGTCVEMKEVKRRETLPGKKGLSEALITRTLVGVAGRSWSDNGWKHADERV